jgi:hypothetical protein
MVLLFVKEDNANTELTMLSTHWGWEERRGHIDKGI